MQKKWYHSRTLYLNGLVFLGSLISGVVGENWLDGEVQLMALSIIDILLRIITKQGLEKSIT